MNKKNTIFALLFFLVLFSVNACKKDKCADTNCVNGACFEGACQCDPCFDLDANGQCTVEKDCGDGNCVDGTCICDPCFSKDASGNCTIEKDCGYGTCDNGVCICSPGYEQDVSGKCTIETRAKLIGTFFTMEQCNTDPSPLPYTIKIEKGVAAYEVNIFNFYNSFTQNAITAFVSGNTISIPAQNPASISFIQVQGFGTINPANAQGKVEISLTYTVADQSLANPTPTAICTNTVFVKQ